MTLVASALSVVLALRALRDAAAAALERDHGLRRRRRCSRAPASRSASSSATSAASARTRRSRCASRRSRASAPAPDAAYFRGLAFDTFDGRSWSIIPPQRSPVAGSAEGGVSFGRERDRVNLVQRIVREPVDSGVLFGVGEPRELQGTVRRLERDTQRRPLRRGPGARADPLHALELPAHLARRRLCVATRSAPEPREPERYLQLPALSPEVASLARRITAGAASDAERARAIESHLARTGRYTDTPAAPSTRTATRSPIEALPARRARRPLRVLRLGDGGARARGRPARAARERLRGRPGEPDRRLRRAHALGRAHLGRGALRARRLGALRPDAAGSARAAGAGALARRCSCASSAARSSCGGTSASSASTAPTRSTPRSAPGSPGRAPRAAASEARSGGASLLARLRGGVAWREVAALLACASPPAACSCAGSLRRRAAPALPADYAAALRLLARRGLVRTRAADRPRLRRRRRRGPPGRRGGRLRAPDAGLSRAALRRPPGRAGSGSASCAPCAQALRRDASACESAGQVG